LQRVRRFSAVLLAALGCTAAHAAPPSPEPCPRPAAGSSVAEPEDLRSRNGVLQAQLTVRNSRQSDGTVRYCYVLPDGSQSPTFRLRPGDLFILRLKNELVDLESAAAITCTQPSRTPTIRASAASCR